MSTFHLSIITPAGTAYDGPAEGVIAPGADGEFGVLGGHAPMIAVVRRGVLRVQCPGRQAFFAVGESLLEVSSEGVLVLAERASEHVGLREAQQKIMELEKPGPRSTLRSASDTQAGVASATLR
jgi:F-type H+-transporting ATPase subunit epsilon